MTTEDDTDENMTDMIAAKFYVYEEILRALVRKVPDASDIREEINLTIEHWRNTLPDSSYLARVAEETRDEIFNDGAEEADV